MPLVALALAAVVLAAPAASAVAAGGLRGVVLREPAYPVCRDDPCTAPAANVVLVFSRGGRAVARTTTARNGTYRIRLAPGRYAVAGARRAPRVGLTPRTVVVPRVGFKRVDFRLDSGLQ